MSDKVDTRISPTLDPGVMPAAIPDYDDDTRPYLGPTETLLSESYQALQSVHDAKAAAATNPTLNEFAQLVAVDMHASKRAEAIYKKWDSVSAALETKISAWEGELSKAVESRTSTQLAGEIRAHFKALKTGERMTAIQQAIRDGDEVTATAVLGGPPYLSGLDAEMAGVLRREWHEATNPALAKRLRAVTAARDILNDRLPLFRKELKKAVGVIEETKEDVQGRKIVVKTWTPAEVRARVKAANEPFAVPV